MSCKWNETRSCMVLNEYVFWTEYLYTRIYQYSSNFAFTGLYYLSRRFSIPGAAFTRRNLAIRTREKSYSLLLLI
jgi:hypothetical protein